MYRNKNKLSTWDNWECSWGIVWHGMALSTYPRARRASALTGHIQFFHAEPSNCTHDDAINLTLNDAACNSTYICVPTLCGVWCVHCTIYNVQHKQLQQQQLQQSEMLNFNCTTYVDVSVPSAHIISRCDAYRVNACSMVSFQNKDSNNSFTLGFARALVPAAHTQPSTRVYVKPFLRLHVNVECENSRINWMCLLCLLFN